MMTFKTNKMIGRNVTCLALLATLAVQCTAQAQLATWQYGYDAMGRPTTVQDPNGLSTYTYYDRLGRPIQTQQPANTGSSTPTITEFAYNPADTLTRVTDPRNLQTNYTPNGLRNVTALSSPDTGASSYTYDAAGNLASRTDARGKLTQYSYDSLNRLTRMHYSTGTDSVFEYDGGATPTPAAAGELTKVSDATGQLSYSYDSSGRLANKTQATTLAGVTRTFTVGYSWGNAGSALDKLTAITYPSGARVNYSYDSHGDVAAITVNPGNANGVGTGGTAVPLLANVTRNAEGKLTGWSWSSGKVQAIGYDAQGQVASYNLGDPTGTGIAAGVQRTVLRDNAGRITGYTHTSQGAAAPTLDQGFSYDSLNRLKAASLGGTSAMQYSYDATGNRTSQTVGGTAYANTIAANSNRMTQTQSSAGTASLLYTASGSLSNDASNTYTYADSGRMSQALTPSGTVAYAYNALELRVGKSGPTALVPSGKTYYVYDEEGKLLGEYDATGKALRETVYLGLPVGVLTQSGTIAAADLATTVSNVWTDQLGAARMITRPSDEAIQWRWDTAEAFGATAPNENPSGLGSFTFNQRLPGQLFDAETGLLQNWHREYNPRIGRYVQSDPIGLQGGINTFAYVGGSPLSLIDYLGLQMVSSRPSYDRNDVRGGFEENGDSSVFNQRSYNPRSAAELLIMGALNMAGASALMCGPAIPEYNLTQTVLKTAQSRPYNNALVIREIISTGKGVRDLGGVPGAFRYDVAGTMNGSRGSYELVVNHDTNMIYHFLFKSAK